MPREKNTHRTVPILNIYEPEAKKQFARIIQSRRRGSPYIDLLTYFGTIHSSFSNGDPMIKSKIEEFRDLEGEKKFQGGKLESYVNIFKAFSKMKREGVVDSEIAQALLDKDADFFWKKGFSSRPAAMLTGIVYFAEDWRKHGAQKLFETYLYMCTKGKATFTLGEFSKYFKFKHNKYDGIEEVKRVFVDRQPAGSAEKKLLNNVQNLEKCDYDSDSEGTRKAKDDAGRKTKRSNKVSLHGKMNKRRKKHFQSHDYSLRMRDSKYRLRSKEPKFFTLSMIQNERQRKEILDMIQITEKLMKK